MKSRIKRKAKKIIYKIFFTICWLLARLLPLDTKKIVFDNFNGLGYSCNPKYIAEYFRNNYPDFKLVWIVRNNEDKTIPKGIKRVYIDSWRMIRELATAGFWINNVRLAYCVKKRKNQYYIQTWHGGYGGKKSEKDVEDKLNPWYLKMAKLDSKVADLFLSNSRLMTDHYHKTYWYNGEVLESGFPRNDILLMNEEERKISIREKLGIGKDENILLYAPTFRDDHRIDAYQIPLDGIRESLHNRFGGTWKIIYRMHPTLMLFNTVFEMPSDVINGTEYPDIQELVLISDVLLTDYSSAYLDFILMKKTIFFFMPDYEDFMKERAFHFDLTKLFIPCSFDENALLTSIREFNEFNYMKGMNDFIEWYKFLDDGRACERVADWIVHRA